MRICCIHCKLGPVLRKLGHDVLELKPEAGFYCLAPVLAYKRYVPELLIQQETLGPRTLIADLENIFCPKVYWSIDTHLNAFWQKYYGRLFDLVLATQKDWLPYLAHKHGPDLGWLPWHGTQRNWTPWQKRKHQISFVGRITEHRPLRQNFVNFLNLNFKTNIVQDLSLTEMLSLYSDTRIVPNESILGEINFRTFEATSCGCLVCNQNIGQGIEELFVPGQEIMLFDHASELKALLNYYNKHDNQARNIAVAARERIHKEHLPGHRAKSLLERAQAIAAKKMDPNYARAAFWLTACQLWEAGRIDLDPDVMIRHFSTFTLDADILSFIMRLYYYKKSRTENLALLLSILQKKQHVGNWQVNLTGSHVCLKFNQWDLASQFWLRYCCKHKKYRYTKPENAAQLYKLWAGVLQSKGQIFRPGFLFDPKLHVPCSALECLFMAYETKPEDLNLVKQMDKLLSRYRGLETTRLSILSHLSLHLPKEWRFALELGWVNLQAFREQQGFEELLLASKRAFENKEQEVFRRSLSRRDKTGQLRYLFTSKKGEW